MTSKPDPKRERKKRQADDEEPADDESMPDLELKFGDDVFDRVTAIPDAPPDDYAKELMKLSPPSEDPRVLALGGKPTPISLPPRPTSRDAKPTPDLKHFGTGQQDTTNAISIPPFELPSIEPSKPRPDSVSSFDLHALGDLGSEDDFDSLPDPDDVRLSPAPASLSSADLVNVPHLPRNPPPVTTDLDPFHAALGREDLELPAPIAQSSQPAPYSSDDESLPPALGGRSPTRRTPLSEVPSVLGASSGALSFVDAHSYPPARLPAAEDLPQDARPSSVPPFARGAAQEPSVRDLRERYALGDFSGALDIAEALLEKDPDSPEALRLSRSCHEVLTQMYVARLSPLDQRPQVAVAPEKIRWLSLDHRAGFLLSLIDGHSSVEELLDVCGMPRRNALRILCDLVDQDVVTLR